MKWFVMVALLGASIALSAPAAFAQYVGEYGLDFHSEQSEGIDVVRDMYYTHQGGWPDAMVGRAQQVLRDQGYWKGPVDGYVTPQFRQAVWNYQRDRKLPLSGGLDRFTVVALNQTIYGPDWYPAASVPTAPAAAK
jgi:hypothetical protein